MKKRIEDKLLDLGVSPCLKGFDLICDAVEILVKDNRKTKITAIYQILAARENETMQTIERKIRYAISRMDMDAYRRMGGNSQRNGDVLCLIAFWIQREEKGDE